MDGVIRTKKGSKDSIPPPQAMAPEANIYGHLNPFTTPLAPQPDQGIPAGLFTPEQMRRAHYGTMQDGNQQFNQDGKPKRKYVMSGRYKRTSCPEMSGLPGVSPIGMGNGMHMPREHTIYKREVEFDMMLPFRLKRIEKNNNNGSKK